MMHKRKPDRAGHGAPLHQVRIIGGQWKRTPLAVLEADGLRPTPDRVRETLFNWLNHLLDGRWDNVSCLDLFAGTGALGFEAASRGAVRVMMVESSVAAVKQLQATKEKLHATQVSIMRGDAGELAAGGKLGNDRFNIIFLDPPYHQGWLGKLLPLCVSLLADDGMIYAETEYPIISMDAADLPDWMSGWMVVRAGKAGMVYYHLLKRNNLL
jgi:16S rRNA (guanine(966)-N(2))-methyltransferase RsmD